VKWHEQIVAGAADAMFAGAAVGVVETLRLLFGSDRTLPGAVGVLHIAIAAIGLSMLGALVLGPPVLLLSAGVRRTTWFAAWWQAMRTPGEVRSRAVMRLKLAVLAALAIAGASFYLAVWSYGKFNAPGAVGVLHAAITAVVAVGVAVAALAIDQSLGPLASRWQWGQRLTSGWFGWAALAGGGVLVAVAAVLFLRRAAPAYDFRPALTLLGFFAALGAARLVRVSARLPALARGAAAAGCVVLVAVSLLAIGSWAVARQAIAANGIASGSVLRTLWKLSDRDGDGFPGAFGGGDCDDSNPRVHPGAAEILDNGVDENCQGGDLRAESFGPRAATQSTNYDGAPRHNVILISIDAVRADHVSAYGYERPTTPTIESLAARGALFEWAITPAPTTRRAIPALMTARYASTLALRESDKHWPPTLIKGRHTILGEVFKRAGYDTKAIMCCTTLFNNSAGVTIGIDSVDASAVKKYQKTKYNGDELADKAVAWIGGRAGVPKPFFLWMHFIDPHNPYKQLPGAPDFGSRAIDRYDSEIAFVDAQVARVFDAVRAAGIEDTTIVAITADHGDEFHEHGSQYHALTTYNEVVRVPLVVAYPGAPARRIAPPVSMMDVGPTLLDLVGLATPAGANGRSLAPSVRDGAAPPDRVVLAEVIADRNVHRSLKAAFYGTWKIIWDLDANTYELYSLTGDPGDTTDARGAHPDVFADMKARLHEAIDRELTLLPDDLRKAELDEENRRRKANR
jgi:arylsulfatase A-like enzyme